jgi:uncharacterized damage-inducible protein DinB
MNADHARLLADHYAGVFDQEGAITAKVLKAVPDSGRDYRPDEKSRTAWELATHLATSDIWFLDGICDAAFAYDPETEKRMTAGFQTVHDVVEYYTREFPKRIQRLRETPGEKLAQEVDFFGMKMPPVAVLPIANNHSIHHRGQLAAYLRAAGSKVPSIYGGSADEPFTPASA